MRNHRRAHQHIVLLWRGACVRCRVKPAVGVAGSPGHPVGGKLANSSSVQDGAFAKNVGQAVVDWILERLSDYHKRCVISPVHLSESRRTHDSVAGYSACYNLAQMTHQ